MAGPEIVGASLGVGKRLELGGYEVRRGDHANPRDEPAADDAFLFILNESPRFEVSLECPVVPTARELDDQVDVLGGTGRWRGRIGEQKIHDGTAEERHALTE